MKKKQSKSEMMSKIKNSGSLIERMLAREMWKIGLRYRKNDATIFGKPDFTFKKYKIAIFCDGDFWHGRDWETKKNEHKTNVEFWHQKIAKNIERDKIVNLELKKNGWIVIRFWGNDVIKDVNKCVQYIIEQINEKKNNHE